ncbi:hypothetical protein SEA_NICEHOUSE_210 [Rhodococcus phage NiceHouse]|nr:hypothetical protein SEA_NICEHOUSE_210 [Rhodococcus phage NiceHouse]
MFESQIIRILVYLAGFYTLIAASHQLIVSKFWDFQSWVLNAVDSPTLATIIVGIGIPIGLTVIIAAVTNRRMPLLWALSFLFTYQIGSAVLNITDTGGKGTPSVPAIFIGLFAATLWGYYKLKPEALHMQETIDNSVEGCTIIQDNSKSC